MIKLLNYRVFQIQKFISFFEYYLYLVINLESFVYLKQFYYYFVKFDYLRINLVINFESFIYLKQY